MISMDEPTKDIGDGLAGSAVEVYEPNEIGG
jgi:hypothetical protein